MPSSFCRQEIKPYELEELDEEEDRSIPADPSVKNFSYTVVDSQVYYRENSLMHPVEVSVTAENRIRGMIELRECVRRLIEYQTEGYPDEDIESEQQKLNALYDSFTAKYGLISSRGNKLAFSEDSSYCLLCSLEVLDEQGNLKRKADMFTRAPSGPMWLSPAWIRPVKHWRCPFRKKPAWTWTIWQSCRANPRRNWKESLPG